MRRTGVPRSGGAGNRNRPIDDPSERVVRTDEPGYSRGFLERTKISRLIARSLFVDNDI
jgi:hypothetical protein